ncbi:MAG: transposase, partial [Clostridiales bacterium]|nr:transposase [Clostridiales bacterium]
NGFTEGVNNKIKVLKRIAFGYRSFRNFRTRILCMTNG